MVSAVSTLRKHKLLNSNVARKVFYRHEVNLFIKRRGRDGAEYLNSIRKDLKLNMRKSIKS